jgi:hypothetical protein
MDTARSIVAIGIVAIALTACGSENEAAESSLPRQPLRPTEAAVPNAAPSTTSVPVDPRLADQLAHSELRSVLAAAREWYAENGTFDDGPGPVPEMTEGIAIVSLVDVAARDGVAYDAHGSRLTLHRQSASGAWFCIDVRGQATDHGFGDSFQDSLATCTDGVTVVGWGDSVSPTGPDEAAIDGVLQALLEALETGSPGTAYALFSPDQACRPIELSAGWPEGLTLTDSADYELVNISVGTETATSSISAQVLSNSDLPFVQHDGSWHVDGDPCELLIPIAAERMDWVGRELLEEGLVAVRSLFVSRSDFDFRASLMAEREPSLTFAPLDDVRFGALAYFGSPAEGLLITEGSPGRFYCAVESLTAVTAYGEAAAPSELATPARCRAHATG